MKITKKGLGLGALALGVVAVVGIGSTFAFMKDEDTSGETLGLADLRVYFDIDEQAKADLDNWKYDEPIAYPMRVRNEGEQDQLVRAMVFAHMDYREDDADPWTSLSTISETGETIISLNDQSSDWIDGGDGWFYYLKPIDVNSLSEPLFESFTVQESLVPADQEGSYRASSVDMMMKVEAVANAEDNYVGAFFKGNVPTEGPLKTVADTYAGLTRK